MKFSPVSSPSAFLCLLTRMKTLTLIIRLPSPPPIDLSTFILFSFHPLHRRASK